MTPYGYIYKTTNIKTGQFYIGQHKIKDNEKLEDYLGSGTHLLRQLKNTPKTMYLKEILQFCKDNNELNDLESYYCNSFVVSNPLCMNIKTGGNHFKANKSSIEKMLETKRKNNSFSKYWLGKKRSPETIEKMRKNRTRVYTKRKNVLPSVIKICPICQKEFVCKYNSKQKTCSNSCHLKRVVNIRLENEKKIEVMCEICGKKTKKYAYKNRPLKSYCSQKCYWKSMKKENNESVD